MTGSRRGFTKEQVVPLRAPEVYDLRVRLRDIDPPIWRRIQVAGTTRLDQLHTVLQKAMGWTDSHLHEFIVGERRYGVPEPDEPEYEVEKEWLISLKKAAPKAGSRFQYLYDFGDGWLHDVVVERTETPGRPFRHPVCLDGARRCPPEGCGGISGYEDLVAILADPRHREHDERRAWVGPRFDAEAFDRAAINRKLRLLG